MCQASKEINIAKQNTDINMSMKQSLIYMKTETRKLYSGVLKISAKCSQNRITSFPGHECVFESPCTKYCSDKLVTSGAVCNTFRENRWEIQGVVEPTTDPDRRLKYGVRNVRTYNGLDSDLYVRPYELSATFPLTDGWRSTMRTQQDLALYVVASINKKAQLSLTNPRDEV